MEATLDYAVSAGIIAILAVASAFMARYPLHVIPWLHVLKNPSEFGSPKQHQQSMLVLLSWVITSVFISFVITYSMKNTTPLVKTLYASIGYDNQSGGTPGLISIVFVNIVFYLYLNARIKFNFILNRLKFPKRLLDHKETGESNKNTESLQKNETINSHIKKIFSTVYNAIPGFLSNQFYEFFHTRAGQIADVLAKSLLKHHGVENILAFFRYHTARCNNQSNKKIFLALQEGETEGYIKALNLLLLKIELKGFYATENYISDYLKLGKVNNGVHKRRKQQRLVATPPLQINYKTETALGTSLIKDYSEDGSGCLLDKCDQAEIDKPLSLEINHEWHIVRPRHKNTGCGIYIENETTKSLFLEEIKKHCNAKYP